MTHKVSSETLSLYSLVAVILPHPNGYGFKVRDSVMRKCGTGIQERSEVPVCQRSSYQLNMHCIQTHGTYHLQCNNETC